MILHEHTWSSDNEYNIIEVSTNKTKSKLNLLNYIDYKLLNYVKISLSIIRNLCNFFIYERPVNSFTVWHE